MLLRDELRACECNDSREEFRKRLIDGLQNFFPGKTIDGLLCNPPDALEYCDQIRQEVGSQSLSDVLILKTLVNIRKNNEYPTGLGTSGTRRNLKSDLKAAGCELEPDQFKEMVVDCLADMYKDQTVDGLVCHPRQALAYCNYVRSQTGCKQLDNEFILSSLMNVRKASGRV